MFEAIVSKVTNVIRNAARAIGTTLNRSPWIVPVAFLVMLFLA
jgi:hypothetical protein